jgi:hypothetical protein
MNLRMAMRYGIGMLDPQAASQTPGRLLVQKMQQMPLALVLPLSF